MKVGLRVSIRLDGETAHMGTEGVLIVPELSTMLYPTLEAAQADASIYGGIALEVEAASLKKVFSTTEVDFVGEGKRRVIDGYLTSKEDEYSPVQEHNFLAVNYGSLPHTYETEVMNEGEENEYEESYPVFTPEGRTWLTAIQEELGASVHL